MNELLILDHVHWDREWYRPHEAFRARLVELVETVLTQLESGERPFFHLDGQTITVADVLEVRPELEPRLRALVADGRLTVGPWHVLADNQLVSGECLVRNLLLARRWGERLGGLAGEGYSPDAFGHPGDLPRILRGFGISTALVWRGAPPQHPRFRWRSPDGSEVFAVNQRYHEAEVLWDPENTAELVREFAEAQTARCPDGPWLLMNGGDHLLPRRPADRSAAFEEAGVQPESVSLREFFIRAAASAGDELPVVEGELRTLGDRLTFLLPGTLSARTYLKQVNAAAQSALSDWAEPLAVLAPAPEVLGLLDHAWDLMVQNAPHDSVCGCSVDEVHEQNVVRAERVHQIADHLVHRSLQRLGLETRRTGPAARSRTHVAVLNPHARTVTQGVEVELLTAVDRWPVSVRDADGNPLTFDAEDLGEDRAFEADLDLMPDTAPVRRHRLAFVAIDVPARSRSVVTVELADAPGASVLWTRASDVTVGTVSLHAREDAGLDVRDGDLELVGVARLLDGGDRGDTYTWDPPVGDVPRVPRLLQSSAGNGAARTQLRLTAVLTVPTGLCDDRAARSTDTVDIPVEVVATIWHGVPGLDLRITLDNRARDHRLRLHVPAARTTTATTAPAEWVADAAYSLVTRPLGPELGISPQEPGLETGIGVAPVQSVAALGAAEQRVAIVCPGLPEVQGLAGDGAPELAVTLVRSVGWLSRFDLSTRTAGAGPQFATPGAQCQGPQTYKLGVRWGSNVADDFDLAKAGAVGRAPLRAHQLHETPSEQRSGAVLKVEGALVTAWKPAQDREGTVLRLSNPTAQARRVRVSGSALTSVAALEESDLDERRSPGRLLEDDHEIELELSAFGLLTLRLLP